MKKLALTVALLCVLLATGVLAKPGATIPTAPIITATEVEDGFVSLFWDTTSLPDAEASAVYVYRAPEDDLTQMARQKIVAYLNGYTSITATNDSTYFYSLRVVDALGTLSSFGPTIGLQPTQTGLHFIQSTLTTPAGSDTTGGNILASVQFSTNRPTFKRIVFWDGSGSAPDTTGTAWGPSTGPINAQFDSGVAYAETAADSGNLHMEWTAATGHTGYVILGSANNEAYAVVKGDVDPDSTTYTWDDAGAADIEPKRGRVVAAIAAYNAAGDTSAYDVSNVFLNQANELYVRVDAIEDTLSSFDNIASATRYVLYKNTPADTTPPDTSGVFTAAALAALVDTTAVGGGVVTLDFGMLNDAVDLQTNEPVQIASQWSNDGGSTWYDADDYRDWDATTSSYSKSFRDTINTNHTLDDFYPAGAKNVELSFRFKLKDASGNESGYVTRVGVPYTRKSDGTGDSVVTKAFVYVAGVNTATQIRCMLFDASGNILTMSAPTTIGTVPGWTECATLETPTLVEGTNYFVAAISNGYWTPAGTNVANGCGYMGGFSIDVPPAVLQWDGSRANLGNLSLYFANTSDDPIVGLSTIGSVTSVSISGSDVNGSFNPVTSVTVP